MHLAVLGSANSWYVADLRRAAKALDRTTGRQHRITPISYKQLASSVGPAGVTACSGELDVMTVDAVLVRSMPPGTLEQVVFRMDLLARLEASGVAVVNPPKACETAIDKFLTTAKLQAAGLLVPETYACQTADQAVAAFETLGGDVVIKPLFGGEGRGITRVNDPAIALRVMKTLEQLGAVLYLQRFIPHEGHDLRLLVVGEKLFAMRRSNPLDWRTNVSLGAVGEAFEPTAELAHLARRGAEAVGATLGGIDVLPGRDGKLYVLEVNAVPGWQALSRATGVDIASEVLEHVGSARQAEPTRFPLPTSQVRMAAWKPCH